MQAYQSIIAERMDEGLRAIEQAGLRLMHEIASEMWRSAGGDANETRASILSELSRDQAIRGLIAHSDERFQALAVRTAGLEDSLAQMVESNRALKDVMGTAAQAVQEMAAGTPELRIEDVRRRLTEVSEHIEATFERIDERDRMLLGSIKEMNGDHGRMIAHETGRIVEALEGYVQSGVDAIGRLAQRVEQQAEATAGRADQVVERLTGELGEQLALMYERIGLETRNLTDSLSQSDASSDRFGAAIMQVLDQRVRALAEMMRSDARALSKHIVDTATAQDHAVTRAMDDRLVLAGYEADQRVERVTTAIDERMTKISEAITAASRWTVEESARRTADAAQQAMQAKVDEIVVAVDRNMVRVSDTLESQVDRLAQSVAERAGQAAEVAIQQRFDSAMARLESAIGSLESAGAAVESTGLAMERQQMESESAFAQALDERTAALARLIRSDNKVLGERLAAGGGDVEIGRQTLRALKELQANLPAETTGVLDRRFAAFAEQLHRESQETAETVAKVAEVLSVKMDRLGVRYENDMQGVIESLGTAVQSIAMLGRRQQGTQPQRIDLD